MSVLDLTDPLVAAKYGYDGGPISTIPQAIGERALLENYSAIRYYSLRDPGGVNLAVIKDFNRILIPEMVTVK